MATRATRVPNPAPTSEQILDVAQRLVQRNGWNGFSYADIAAEMGIRKASIHHHFKTKAELGYILLFRYREAFRQALLHIERQAEDPRRRLEEYIGLFGETLRQKRLCLCGMLAAEFDTLPTGVRGQVYDFFHENEKWLTGIIAAGKREKRLRFTGPPSTAARFFLSSLEGALLVARAHPDKTWFDSATRSLLSSLGARPAR
jgi:TetR/AcrR family transcriptional repressor of nem operon